MYQKAPIKSMMCSRNVEERFDGRVGRYGYLRSKLFLDNVKRSRTLTPQQKQELWERAIHGDLEGAMREFEELVSVRREAF